MKMLGEVNLTHNVFPEIVFSRERLKFCDFRYHYNLNFFLKMSFKFIKALEDMKIFFFNFNYFC